MFFKLFTFRVKFCIFKLTIAMVWNNSIALSTCIIFATTFSTNFGVLVYVIGFLNPFVDDPTSYTIILPNSNSNGNPFANFGILGGTCSFDGLNTSKACCVATLSIRDLIALNLLMSIVVIVANVMDLQMVSI